MIQVKLNRLPTRDFTDHPDLYETVRNLFSTVLPDSYQ